MSEGNEDNLALKMSSLEIDSRKKSVNRLPVGEDSYLIEKVIGSGSFGVVYRAKCERTSSVVAIKKVLQDKRYKNRELQIIKNLNHCNIVELKNSFYTEEGEKVFLHLVLEYVPETLYKICRTSSKKKIKIPLIQCKLYIYQMCRSLAYLHSKGVCHRDIKPQNLLIDSNLGVLKLCDFGSAKVLVKNEPNISYICSRYYRAPELIFGASNYSTSIDIWSTGCVLGELLIGKPLFQGDSTLDQLVEIVKILGTPTQEQVHAMNQNYLEFRFPYIPPLSWTQVLGANCPPEAADLLSKILVFKPGDRLKSIEICAHPFFDELRENPNGKLENGASFPPLFNFTPEELSYISPEILQKLQPKYPTPSV